MVWKRLADIASTDHLELGGKAPVIVCASARFAAATPEKARRLCCQQYGRLHI
jgi:acyl-CoA reductase-like NAD-dependent aldehyde dehydrogenase